MHICWWVQLLVCAACRGDLRSVACLSPPLCVFVGNHCVTARLTRLFFVGSNPSCTASTVHARQCLADAPRSPTLGFGPPMPTTVPHEYGACFLLLALLPAMTQAVLWRPPAGGNAVGDGPRGPCFAPEGTPSCRGLRLPRDPGVAGVSDGHGGVRCIEDPRVQRQVRVCVRCGHAACLGGTRGVAKRLIADRVLIFSGQFCPQYGLDRTTSTVVQASTQR